MSSLLIKYVELENGTIIPMIVVPWDRPTSLHGVLVKDIHDRDPRGKKPPED